MILIVEGADLVGKSTLANLVAAVRGWPVVKIRWALIGNVEAETRGMATATKEILCATRPNVIFDRSYFSMWAYGEEVSYMPELISVFDRVSSVAEACLVLLTASPEELQRRYVKNPDHYHSLEIILRANTRFPALLPLLPETLPRMHIDTTDTSPEDTFAQVEALISA